MEDFQQESKPDPIKAFAMSPCYPTSRHRPNGWYFAYILHAACPGLPTEYHLSSGPRSGVLVSWRDRPFRAQVGYSLVGTVFAFLLICQGDSRPNS